MPVHHLKIYVSLPYQGIYSAGSVDIQPVCYEADVEDSDFQEVWLVLEYVLPCHLMMVCRILETGNCMY
jgi:hypothetical protein